MAVLDSGVSAAGKANVDAFFNLNVVTPTAVAQAGFEALAAENDSGAITGTRSLLAAYISRPRRLAVGTDTILMSETFNNTAQFTTRWRSGVTNFVLAQASGYVVMNSTSITTTGSAQVYQSARFFPIIGDSPTIIDMSVSISAAPPTNWTFEAGLFNTAQPLASIFAPTDGIYFRLSSTGLIGVVNYNGTETVTATLIAAGSILVNTNITLEIIINEGIVEFWASNNVTDAMAYLGSIVTPAANGQPASAAALPVTFRLNQPGVASAGVQAKISDITVLTGDVMTNKPYSHLCAAQGQSANEGQSGGTIGTAALYSNSLAAGAGAAAANATATLGSGLGGQFTVQPTLAVPTDGIISSFQNPIGSASQTGRTLYITGVRIQGLVTAAFTGGPVLYAYSLAYGHTAVSLATAESIIAKAPRRIALGFETYVVTAAIGVLGQGITMTFNAPVVINPGEFVQIVAKNMGTVTSAGTITILVAFDGYYE